MAAGDIWPVPRFRELWMDGDITFDGNSTTVKLALYKASLTAYADANLSDITYLTSISTEQVTGGEYTAGGRQLGSMSVTISGSFTVWRAGNVTWSTTTTGFTDARFGVLYKDTGDTATSPIIAVLDLGSARANNAGQLIIQWSTDGIIKFSGTGTPSGF